MPDRFLILRDAAATLGGETARLDAELLLAAALGEERLAMLVGREPVPADALARFEAFLARRRTNEPVAHILGEREFWSLTLRVTRDVLVPRPDSETLIAEALSAFAGRAPATILDLGTGSGALLLAALSEWPQARGIGTDCSEAALRIARHNAGRLGLAGRADFRNADWAEGLDQRLDLILCNPPYVPDGADLMPDVALFDPPSALFGGVDGLEPYRRLLPEVPRLLQAGGVALFEFGEGQGDALLAMAQPCGLEARLCPDLSGRPRVLVLTGLGKPCSTV
ncbi:MAG: peptide chain release factor N(5)-glutamine methyltransferase [Sandaracinobacteroides sp.]